MENEQANAWMTPAEMRRLLGLSKNKTFEILASGQVEAIKLGRCVRVNRDSAGSADPAESLQVPRNLVTQKWDLPAISAGAERSQMSP